jgi:hypothetical protein
VADLRAQLPGVKLAAPALADLGPAKPLPHSKWNLDTHLWLSFAKLDNAMVGLDKDTIRAMPVHEREARGKSAVLPWRLIGAEERDALAFVGLRPVVGRRVYRLAPGSRDLNAKDGDIGWALSPGGDATRLEAWLYHAAGDAGLDTRNFPGSWKKLSDALSVTLVRLDRENGFVVIDASTLMPSALDVLEGAGVCELGRDVVLDPIHIDALTSKLKKVVKKIGLPRSARDNALVARATGWRQPVPQGKERFTPEVPINSVLWGARRL